MTEPHIRGNFIDQIEVFFSRTRREHRMSLLEKEVYNYKKHGNGAHHMQCLRYPHARTPTHKKL
jgi:hypothetical protein